MDIVNYLVLAVCIYIIIVITKGLIQGAQSINWEATQGTVLSSEIVKKHNINSGTTRYTPKVNYEYFANGEKQTNDLITFKGIDFSLKNATASIDKYPVDKRVTVYHHPEKLDQSVLEPGLNKSTIFASAVAVSILLFVMLNFISR